MDQNFDKWPVEVGEKLLRKKLHTLVGGAHQWGITSCMNGTALLVFTNPSKAKKFGYDRWEGPVSNGEYHYTGQGPIGDQDVSTRANRSLLRSQFSGIPVHLFRSERTEVTYLGKYKLAENPYRWERAPDLLGNDRRVVVFQFVRVHIDHA